MSCFGEEFDELKECGQCKVRKSCERELFKRQRKQYAKVEPVWNVDTIN